METIEDLGVYTFPALLDNSVRKFGGCSALALVGKEPLSYSQVAVKVRSFGKMLAGLGLKAGNKIAVLGTGRPEWGISYLGIVCHGMVAVPLLPDFSETELSAIIKHCGVDAVIVEGRLFSKLAGLKDILPSVVIRMEDFSVISDSSCCIATGPVSPAPVSKGNCDQSSGRARTLADFENFPEPAYAAKEEDTASIIYTSGTTGRSKGVELTHKNLVWTCVQCQNTHEVTSKDRTLSFLPLSHVYEFTVGFSMQILNGACVYYLGKPPVVSALLPAFSIVKPTIVLSVPLVMEKIYKNKVLPTLTKNKLMKALYGKKPSRKLLHRIAGASLKKTFGGHLEFFGIGGAKVDPKVEEFMKEAHFPYAIGYGLTETSPLIASSGPEITEPGCIGVVMPGVDVRINNPNPKTGVGEIVVKGENVMKGYYKEPDITAGVFTTSEDTAGEGYLKTGDLGVFEKKHRKPYLILKGRNKNMILGSNGENIYPEDIEFVLNQHPFIAESLVVEGKEGLVAFVKLDEDKVKNLIGKAKTIVSNVVTFVGDKGQLINEIKNYVNSNVSKIARIVKIQEVIEFEKTATQKIKRYLYDLSSAKPAGC
ncbi:MAG: AMP-binding protein [Treponemataceae bacterium]|nr:AMP-binding protein [Treponemataceae bacterium]